MNSSPAERFVTLFAGLERVHGEYVLSGETDERGKAQGSAITRRAPVTLELWQQHLAGKQGLGVVPIRDDNTCVWGCIDVDVYADLDHTAIAKTLGKLSLPLVPCRSKSGGCHLYLFCLVPISAALMRKKLASIAALLGFAQSEIFPKQSKLLPTDNGSWMNMAYFAGDAGTRYGVRVDGMPMLVSEFLDRADAVKVDAQFFAQGGKTSAPDSLPNGPPCLGHLIQIGVPEGGRNEFMANVARYAKRANPTGWQGDVENYNRGCCTTPLDHAEIGKIIESVAKKDYNYSCSRAPLAEHCNRGICRTRTYGIGNSGETHPEYGTLTKYASDPPVWVYEVDGVRLSLSTSQLTDYRQFRKACVEYLTKIIPAMKQADWDQHLSKAFETVHEEKVSEDASDEGQLMVFLEKFCTGRVQALTLPEIVSGKPHTDDTHTHFLLTDFKTYLHRHSFHELTIQEIAATLKEHGGTSRLTRIKGKGSHHVWSIPKFAGYTDEGFDVPDSIKNDQRTF